MDNLHIGHIITTEQHRDAIHMAVAPVVAGETLQPGEHVGIVDGRAYNITQAKRIGIVDPFLTVAVRRDQRFWLFLYPGTITSLRHEWEHPEFPLVETFPAIGPIDHKLATALYNKLHPEHEQRLREFADKLKLPYVELLSAAKNYVESGEYLIEGGRFESVDMPDDFWERYEHVTGERVPEEQRGYFFSCSC